MYLATKLRQEIDGDIEVMWNMCSKHVWREKTNNFRSVYYLNHVCFRNMYCANWRNSCIGARTTV